MPADLGLGALHIDIGGTHITHQPFVKGDLQQGFVEGMHAHGDVPHHIIGAGLNESGGMKAKQGITGLLGQIGQEPLKILPIDPGLGA